MVDSVRQAERAAARKERDSTAKAALAGTAAIHAPIVRFARAIEHHDVAELRAAYPGMKQKQQESWERNFFARAESISAPVHYGPATITRDSADVDFTLMLVSIQKDTKQRVRSPLRQHATLVRKGDAWEIVALR